MKITMEFDTQDADDRIDHAMALKAKAMYGVLWEFDQGLRNEAKYCDNEQAEIFRERLCGLLEEHGVNLDELACP